MIIKGGVIGTGTLNASGQGHQASYGIGGASLDASGQGRSHIGPGLHQGLAVLLIS